MAQPWGKDRQQQHEGNPKKPQPAASLTSTRINYEEIQRDELIVLESMYGEDFGRLESKQGAWKKHDPAFEIRITTADAEINVTLVATLTATYPRTLPLLRLTGGGGLPTGTRFKIQKLIETKPKELLRDDQPMIVEIVEACRDVLHSVADAKAAGRVLPSLEEERAIHEADVARQAEEAKAIQAAKKETETQEEDRMLTSLVEDEFKRQKAKTKAQDVKRKQHSTGNNASTRLALDSDHLRTIGFDSAITLKDTNGDSIRCFAVTAKVFIRKGPCAVVFTARPVLRRPSTGSHDLSDGLVLALKEAVVGPKLNDVSGFKSKLQALEKDLVKLKKIRHRNILELYDYKVHKLHASSGTWTVSILTELSDKASLAELLDITETLSVDRVRSWTSDLLDALQFIHSSNMVHEQIHLGNILLVRHDGEVRPKLSDAGIAHKIHGLVGKPTSNTSALPRSVYWTPNELLNQEGHTQFTAKTDVWQFGICVLQMLFGAKILLRHASPASLRDTLSLSGPLDDLLSKMFRSEPKKRPRACDLKPSEFLATDAPIFDTAASDAFEADTSKSTLLLKRSRRESTLTSNTMSRYEEDFIEVGRLGKGGFGEVVKARKKLDGQIYAIKKISQKSSAPLDEVLKEVQLLSRLAHPCVVRYINIWLEKNPVYVESQDWQTEDDASTADDVYDHAIVFEDDSTGALDFMSGARSEGEETGNESVDDSGDDDDGDDDDSDASDASGDSSNDSKSGESHEDNSNGNNAGTSGNSGDQGITKRPPTMAHRTKRLSSRAQRKLTSIAYIQMEYCEKRTLQDLIRRDLYRTPEEGWRLLKQILDGLAYVHKMGVVHRDMKPANVFVDGAYNVRIGDFGLATTGQYALAETSRSGAAHGGSELTASIGTPLYYAPEIKTGSYNAKVDMYSLGLIFFEMNYHPLQGMEKAHVFRDLREAAPELPLDFDMAKTAQSEIILSLLNHTVKERPSSAELLHSNKIPMEMETEVVRHALNTLTNPNSPYYHKVVNALFAKPMEQAKDFAWDLTPQKSESDNSLVKGLVKQHLTTIFRNHGAMESPRSALFPQSAYYGDGVVKLLDSNGTPVQLAYDLTYPHARHVAKNGSRVGKTFAFGAVYRDIHSGAAPRALGEVDFDIVSADSLDLALKDAEVIKVLDEVICGIPTMSSDKMCFHINHSKLVEIIFDFCGIERSIRSVVSDSLTKLGIQKVNWQSIRRTLKAPAVGMSETSVNDLEKFNFRDDVSKAMQKLKQLFDGTEYYAQASPSIAHLQDILTYAQRFDVRCKIFVSPLATLRENFCKDGIIFSCLHDDKSRDIIAAGGRYDSLVREQSLMAGKQAGVLHAVGFSLAWEKLASTPSKAGKAYLKKTEDEGQGYWACRRCDVLVASHDAAVLRTIGVDVLQNLWANNMSAELAHDTDDARALEEKHREDDHFWVAIVRSDATIKIRSAGRPETEMPSTQLVAWLRAEIREREHREGGPPPRAKLARHASQPESATTSHETEQDVRVLIAGTKSKKTNRRNIVEQAQARAASLVHSFLDGPIAAIETSDQVMELLRQTRLSDTESWRRVTHSVDTVERRYIGEIQQLLLELAREARDKDKDRDQARNAFVYNYKTGMCIYYDLRL